MQKISAIVLCRDGGQTLRACLVSLSFCDTVIVANDGSTDDSLTIAKKLSADIVHLHKTTSFAQKRNEAMAHVKAGWILFVDADEVISKTLAVAIRRAIEQGDIMAFRLKRRDIFLGNRLRFGETGTLGFLGFAGVGSGGSLVRLGRVGCGVWRREVHEVWDVSGQVGEITDGEIIHTPHTTLASFLDTINTYTESEIKERASHIGGEISVWIQFFLYPPAKFFFNYIVRLGILDGVPGFIHAYFMALYSLILRIKMLEYVRAKKAEA